MRVSSSPILVGNRLLWSGEGKDLECASIKHSVMNVVDDLWAQVVVHE